ncbi:hypothetical protein [Halobacillus hunanensis]|uniref:hypothetical protein n=1 Tax=Halobacillus hunanensis TaxID=578214 RepID=UPI0009A8F7D1|nr:hypothetical protein [Halobacillus hunanensis]
MDLLREDDNVKIDRILKIDDTEKFLLELQNYLSSKPIEKIDLCFYKDIEMLDTELNRLNIDEKRLLQIKVTALITYLDEVSSIHLPSPFIIGVFTAVISLILGVMIKDLAAFPVWIIFGIIICFVLFIPGISWLNLIQSGKDAEFKQALTTLHSILDIRS